jgi:hypothetical protein
MADNIKLDDDIFFSDTTDIDSEEEGINEIPKEKRTLRTQAYDKSIGDIIGMIGDGDLLLDPEYQRSYVWDTKKASLLVESIILNVPIPVIYVSEEDDGGWNVVDGLQRLHSLKRFFDNEFKLKDLEVINEFNGLQYSTLNPKASRIIKNGILRVILILKESHPEIKYDIFMRLNRGAIKLNEQELRNCLYRGNLNELLLRLRQNKKFLSLIGLTLPHRRMVDAELILRYLTLSDGYNKETGAIDNYKGNIKTSLNSYCDSHKKIDNEAAIALKSKFESTIDKVYATLGGAAFHRINSDGTTDGRLNRAIMDCIMLSFEGLDMNWLLENKTKIVDLLKRLPSEDQAFNDAISYGTSTKKRLEYRVNKWREQITSIAEV